MRDLNKKVSQLVWRIELLRDFDVPCDQYAVTVTLRVLARDWSVSGYVVYCNDAPGQTQQIIQDRFRVGDYFANGLLLRIVDSFRGKLSELHGGLGVTMDRKRWLAWLNSQYPGQVIRMEAQLLLRHLP